MKKFFGTTSLSKISMEDTNTVISDLLEMKRNKEISSKQYKLFRNFVSDVQDDLHEIQQEKDREQKLLKLKQNEKALKKDKKVKLYLEKMSERAKSELRAIKIPIEEHEEKKKFHVSYIGKIRWEGNDGELYRTAYISEDIRAMPSSSEQSKIFKAFENYVQKNFQANSPPELISWKNVLIVNLEQSNRARLMNVGMGRINMSYVDFKDLPSEFVSADNKCVIDYLMYESASSGRKRWTHAYLENKLGEMPTTKDIIDFATEEGDVSVYPLDMFLNLFTTPVTPEKSRVSLFFICNNKHLYPILDKSIRKSIAVKGKVDFEDMKLQFKDFESEVVAYATEGTDIINMNDKHIIVETDNLKTIAVDIMKHTNTNISSWKIYNHNVVGFKHPLKNQILSAGEDYGNRKMVCDKEFAENNLADFKFLNQGFGQIARAIFENKFGVIPQSDYSPDLKMILKDYPTLPYRMCTDKNAKNAKSIDIHKCYSSILFNNKYDIPIHSGFDVIEKFNGEIVAGQYYLDRTVYAGVDGSIKISKGWYQYELVQYLIDIKVLRMCDITYQLKARGVLKASTFKVFVEYVYNTYDSKVAKNLVNMLVGCFGSLYYRNEEIGITNDWETCVSTLNEYTEKKMKFNEIDGLYVIQKIDEHMKNSGDMTIYRSVIGQSIIALDKMTRAIYIPKKTKIIGYNTDAVKVVGKFNKEKFSKEMGGFELEKCKALMGYTMDELDEYPVYEYKEMVLNVEHDTPMSGRSELRDGPPGCGKTYGLKSWYQDGDIVLAYTNACVEQIKRYGVEAHTFESFAIDPSTGKPTMNAFKGAKRVVLDEYKTLPPSLMSLLLNAKAEFGFQLICIGDNNQTKAPCDNWIEYKSNRRFLEALDCNVVEMTYNPATGRYDDKLDMTLKEFVKTGILKMNDRNTIVSDYNICYSNKMRHRINQICLKRWLDRTGKELVEVGVKKDKWKTAIRVAVGLEMMVYDDNDLINKLYKTHRYVVKEIKENTIVVANADNNVEISFEKFVEIFDYSYCYTMYKIQSITIDKPFNIWEAERMSFNELYTAVSRAKQFDDIHIDTLKLVRYEHDTVEIVTYKLARAEEKTGRIYLVTFNDNSAYIGQTQLTIYERFGQHLMNPTNEAMRIALETKCPKLELVEEIKFTNIKSLRDLEESYIDMFRDVFTLLNKQHNAVVKATNSTEKSVKPKQSKKLIIKDEPDTKRYTINYTENGKYLRKRFSYCLCSKEMAYEDACKWKEEKIKA